MQASVTRYALMPFALPVWLAAGFADCLCRRAWCIAVESGAKESLIHVLMFVKMAVLAQAAIFLAINALVIAAMIAALLLHEVTSLWDVRCATQTGEATPIEQHVHSFPEMLPLMGLVPILPSGEELLRALRANRGALAPLRNMDRP